MLRILIVLLLPGLAQAVPARLQGQVKGVDHVVSAVEPASPATRVRRSTGLKAIKAPEKAELPLYLLVTTEGVDHQEERKKKNLPAVEVRFIGQRFVPSVVVLPKGAQLNIVNSGPFFLHTERSAGPGPQLEELAPGASRQVVFTETGATRYNAGAWRSASLRVFVAPAGRLFRVPRAADGHHAFQFIDLIEGRSKLSFLIEVEWVSLKTAPVLRQNQALELILDWAVEGKGKPRGSLLVERKRFRSRWSMIRSGEA